MDIFICDDDKHDINRLKTLIDEYDSLKHIGFTVTGFRSGMEMLDAMESMPDRTILTLPLDSNNLPIRRSADSTDLKDRHQQILSVMESGKEYRSDDISELVGLKGSRTRQLLKKLIELGMIETTGSTRGKRYVKPNNKQ